MVSREPQRLASELSSFILSMTLTLTVFLPLSVFVLVIPLYQC